MTVEPGHLPQGEREDLIRTAWYSHDARWYNAVAAECGVQAANAANRRAIRQAGAVEARRLHARLGLPPVRSIPEFFAFTKAGRDLFVGPIVEMSLAQRDAARYEVEVTRCFAADQIGRAGLADQYECGIFDRIQGWHEGLGLPLAEDVPTTLCHLANGRRCTRTLRLASPLTAETASPRYTPSTKES